jgi:hypothetical protein
MKKSLALCFLLAYIGAAFGQSDVGTPGPDSFWRVNDAESVNLGNLNIMLHAPIRSKGGPIPFNGTIGENVLVYTPTGNAIYATTAQQFSSQLATGYWHGGLSITPLGAYCGGNKQQVNGITDRRGTFHPLNNVFWDSNGCLPDVDAYTTDNSGLEVIIPKGTGVGTMNPTVYDKSGIGSDVQALGTITDPHGNQITVANSGTTTYTDSLSGTPIVSVSGVPASTTYQYTDGTGTLRTVTASHPSQSILTAFNCPSMSNGSLGAIWPLGSVSYPDGSSVQFTYEKTAANNLNGRLKTVVVPTGATYTHTYSGGTNGDGLWCESGGFQFWVSNATMSISDGTGTWTFARTVNAYPSTVTTTTVTKPDGSKIVYTFTGNIVTSKVTKDTDGTTVLDTMTYCYDSTISSCNPTAPTNHPTWVRAYHTVPGVTGNAEVDTKFDTYGNVLEVDRFDYGPTLVSKTLITYGSWNGSSCVSLGSIHIQSAPCDVQVQNASSVVMSHSRFNYDTATGDLLNSYAFKDATNFLTSTNTYNSNGTVASATRVDGVQTTFDYTGTGGCNSLLPTSGTNAVGFVSMTWDCNGALPTTKTGLTGLTTTTTYGDPLYRVTQISDDGGQAPLVYTYTSPTRSSTHMTFNSGASIIDTTTTLNALGQVLTVQNQKGPGVANYDTISYTYDTSGRLASASIPCTKTQIGTACTNHGTEYTYDGASRIKTQTIKTTTPGVTTYTYSTGDIKMVLTPAPTGENSKIVQIERDGLGRTTRVCSVITSGLSGGGACGERTAANGYLTKYTLDALDRVTQVTRNAQAGATPVVATALYDFLGRLTSQSVPETGTTTNHYDTATINCPQPFAGHLTSIVNAATDELCIWYDNLGRAVSSHAAVGPNANVTPVRKYVYDTNHQGGQHIANRVAEVFTCAPATDGGVGVCTFGNSSAHLTNEQFSYDAYGRVIDVWEHTPGLGSGVYFHTSATYWDNSAPASLSGIPGVSNFTFGIDAQGRTTSASAGATGIVSSVAFDPGSNPTTITYSNGDSDNYTWDSFSQNMTQAQFKMGAANTTDTHAYTWNPNGTLKQLQITDNITSADTQTCPVAHDDLGRVTSFNCGALWNESYAYSPDYAGNVTKSGSLSFAPGYTGANQMLPPYTYHNTGNMLHDATLGIDYGWDARGSMTSYAGNSVVNDPFGNMVEKTVAGTKTYFLHTPIGKLGSTSSLTAKLSLKIPLPGGSSITYDSAGNERINHKDFTGSTRLRTNRVARTLVDVFCYGPMGEVYCGTAANSQYEGTAQDTTSGLGDFNATRYSASQGRSIQPNGGPNGFVKTNRPF